MVLPGVPLGIHCLSVADAAKEAELASLESFEHADLAQQAADKIEFDALLGSSASEPEPVAAAVVQNPLGDLANRRAEALRSMVEACGFATRPEVQTRVDDRATSLVLMHRGDDPVTTCCYIAWDDAEANKGRITTSTAAGLLNFVPKRRCHEEPIDPEDFTVLLPFTLAYMRRGKGELRSDVRAEVKSLESYYDMFLAGQTEICTVCKSGDLAPVCPLCKLALHQECCSSFSTGILEVSLMLVPDDGRTVLSAATRCNADGSTGLLCALTDAPSLCGLCTSWLRHDAG